MNVLLDEETDPPLRSVIGRLMASATTADFAVAAARLAAIDLTEEETAGVARCRILLGRLDAQELASLGEHRAALRPQLLVLQRFLLSGRVEVRSAGMAAWLPDFSVYSGLRHGAAREVCVVGAHYFRVPWIEDGPSLTCVLSSQPAVTRAQRRFERLWEHAHDVMPAVVAALEQVLQKAGTA
jgi:hypothetical protein